MSDSLLLTKSTGGQDELVLERLFPAGRDFVFLGVLATPDEAGGEAELADISLAPVLRLMGMGQGGLVAAWRGLLLGVLLWLRGLVMRAKGAS